MESFNDKMMNSLQSSLTEGTAQFPPNVFKLLKGEFIKYEEGKSIEMRFPIQDIFDNPFHITFGGTIGMYFDMAFGPFSGRVTGKATTSLDLNVSFLKPISVKDEYVTVKASVLSLSKQFLTVEGRAYKGEDILVATATSRMMIFDPKRMQKKMKQ